MTRAEIVEACLAAAGAGMEIAPAWGHALLVPALKADSLPAALVLPAGLCAVSGCVSGLVFVADAIADDEGRADLDPPVQRWKRGERDGLSQRLVAFGSWPDGEIHVRSRRFVTPFAWTGEVETMTPFAGMVHSSLEAVWNAGKLQRAQRRAMRARQGAEFDIRHRPVLAATLLAMGCPMLLASDIRRHLSERASTN